MIDRPDPDGQAAPASSESATRGLADALADRAMSRTVTAAAVAALVTIALATVFLVMAGGLLGPQSMPQVLILGSSHLIALATAGLVTWRRRRARSATGDGPRCAALSARDLTRALVGMPVLGLLIGVGCLTTMQPRVITALSVAVSLAIVAQVCIVFGLQRRGLLRAARSPLPPPD